MQRRTFSRRNTASCSRKIAIICSSVNRHFLMVQLLVRPSDITYSCISLPGSHQVTGNVLVSVSTHELG